jgi:hypothetical protein
MMLQQLTLEDMLCSRVRLRILKLLLESQMLNSNDSYSTSASVTITLTVEDATSGVAQMPFSHDDISWTAWESYSASKLWMLTPDDDPKTIGSVNS